MDFETSALSFWSQDLLYSNDGKLSKYLRNGTLYLFLLHLFYLFFYIIYIVVYNFQDYDASSFKTW